MRNYLYIWHDSKQKFIITSGITFKDIASYFGNSSGLILLNHDSENVEFHDPSRFEYVNQDSVNLLSEEDIYSWGNFCWIDYKNNDSFPNLKPQEIAEILYFGHQHEPLTDVKVIPLNNTFMYYAHDDGWFSKIYYSSWDDVSSLLNTLDLPFNRSELINDLKISENAFWVSNGTITTEDKTLNIDEILNKYL